MAQPVSNQRSIQNVFSKKTALALVIAPVYWLVACLPGRLSWGQESTAQTAKSASRNMTRAFGKRRWPDFLIPPINEAIDAAAGRGGGTVRFPAGNYLSFSIHLKSNIALYLEQGQSLSPLTQRSRASYDLPEPNDGICIGFRSQPLAKQPDLGCRLENVSIIGPGMINGKGLTRRDPPDQAPPGPGRRYSRHFVRWTARPPRAIPARRE
jgi:hypothetical protein